MKRSEKALRLLSQAYHVLRTEIEHQDPSEARFALKALAADVLRVHDDLIHYQGDHE